MLPAMLALATSLAGCGQPDGNHLFLVSREAAEVIGRQDYAETLRQARTHDALDVNPDQVALVNAIAARLVEVAKRSYPVGRDWQWEIHVISSPQVNAFCSPGGKIAVLSGLLEATRMDPDQVATVIGHEISHALLEHTRASLSRDWLLESGMWIVAKSLKMGAVRSQSAIEEVNTMFMPMHRDQEREADRRGLELMARAGFDPQRGIQFWRTTMARRAAAGQGDKHLEAFLSTHPTDEDRLTRLSEQARQLGKQGARP
jgi:Zn-dependent protease with chaperone function